jgi:hypothetical protein
MPFGFGLASGLVEALFVGVLMGGDTSLSRCVFLARESATLSLVKFLILLFMINVVMRAAELSTFLASGVLWNRLMC